MKNFPPLLIFHDIFVTAWDGISDPLECEVFEKTGPKSNPFLLNFDTDAHCTAYSVPEEKKMPRLALGTEKVLNVRKFWVLVDIDNGKEGEKKCWTDSLLESTFEKLSKLPEIDHAGWYLTRHGMRLVWPLEESIEVKYASDFQDQFLDYLVETTGIPYATRGHGGVDGSVNDWTRLFRLPRVIRKGEKQDHEEDFENMGPLQWTPSRELKASDARIPTLIEDRPFPDKVTKPKRADYKGLENSEFYHRMIDGASLGEDGERNNATIRAIGQVVAFLEVTDPFFVYKLLYRSVEAQIQEGSKRDLNWFWGRCCYVVDLHSEDINKRSKVREALEESEEKERQSLKEKAAIALGIPEEDVHHHLILSHKKAHYVFHEDKMSYGPPVDRAYLFQQLTRFCSTLAGRVAGPKGGEPTSSELFRRYGTQVARIKLIYGKEDTTYDVENSAIIEGCAQYTKGLFPEYNKEIDHWLRLLAGDLQETFLDWLAFLLRTEDPICALYIRASDSVGKGMLAEGLSKLWDVPLTDYDTLTSNFGEELTDCPLLLADEKIEVKGKSSTSIFRRLIGSSIHTVHRKFLPSAKLHGCPRLLITANNMDALSVREDLTPEDIKAIEIRVGYIEADKKASAYLKKLGGRTYTNAWVAGQGIARHVLWLYENRKPTVGDRYLIEGWRSVLSRNLIMLAGGAGALTIAIAALIGEGKIKEFPKCLVGGGKILINARDLLDKWKSLMLGKEAPKEWQLTNSLRSISLDRGNIRKTINGKRLMVWDIDPEYIYEVSNRQHLFDEKALRDIIEKPFEKN